MDNAIPHSVGELAQSIRKGLDLTAGRDIVAGGCITCPEAICAGTNIAVGGSIQSRFLKAKERLSVGGNLNLEGDAVVEEGIRVDGTARCRGLTAGGDILIVGDLLSTAEAGYSGSVATRGDLRVGGEIHCTATLNAAGMHAGKEIVADLRASATTVASQVW